MELLVLRDLVVTLLLVGSIILTILTMRLTRR